MRILLAVLALAFSTLAQAQAFPSRPVTIIIPYPPGGLIDLVARALQPFLQQELGVNVVTENRSGAGGNVGAEVVSRAAPDGHTLLLANPSLAISPTLYKKLNYRPIEDFAYVGRFGSVANVMVANINQPFKTAQELIAFAKKNPGRLNYGSPGYGTSPQLSGELFKTMSIRSSCTSRSAARDRLRSRCSAARSRRSSTISRRRSATSRRARYARWR